jgi:hypothetical protein
VLQELFWDKRNRPRVFCDAAIGYNAPDVNVSSGLAPLLIFYFANGTEGVIDKSLESS